MVKPAGQRTYRQINEFIRILGATLAAGPAPAGPLRVLDLGCGTAYLTVATVRHLREGGIACTVTGVDRDPGTIARNNARTRRLGWQDRLAFTSSLIGDYRPAEPPDLVIALHACDTATDDVLTDALRASLLRMIGYRVDVFTFVPVEHTARNNLVRATGRPAATPPRRRPRSGR